MYKCSKCNLEIIVLPNGEKIRACDCNATIIMEMSSKLNGGTKLVQK
jgi:hypothetical protein